MIVKFLTYLELELYSTEEKKSEPFMFGKSGVIPVLLSQSHTPL